MEPDIYKKGTVNIFLWIVLTYGHMTQKKRKIIHTSAKPHFSLKVIKWGLQSFCICMLTLSYTGPKGRDLLKAFKVK